MSPIFGPGLAMVAVVLLTAALAWPVFGGGWAAAVLGMGLLAVIAYHLRELDRLERWAASGDDDEVPEARGPWRAAFAAVYARARRRSAQQRDLAHTIERFRSVADAIPDGMVVLEPDHRVRWANRRAQLHLGLDPAQDVGRPVGNLVRQPEVLRYLEAGDYSDAVVVDSRREPGVTLSIQVVPFGRDERLLISRDVTKLAMVDRMRRDFIANVSHELKTPLTVVSGFVETLRDLDLREEQRARYLELMATQTRNMQRLVDDLLALSALESDVAEVPDTATSLASLVGEMAAEARALSAGAHAVVVDDGPPLQVIGSRDELTSAFSNLVSNAVRYTPRGGTVRLGWSQDADGSARFSVTDTGVGIGAEHVPRLTERFYRVDRGRSRASGGTGLGLAIVKHVLLRHQAELEVTSEPGHGSRFAVHLPSSRVRRSEGAPSPEATPATKAVDAASGAA